MCWGLRTLALPLPLQHLQRLCHSSSRSVAAPSAGTVSHQRSRRTQTTSTRALSFGVPAPRAPGSPLLFPGSRPCRVSPIPACPEPLGYSGPTSPVWSHSPASGAPGPGSGLRHQRSRARAGSRLTAQRCCFTHSTDCSGSAAPMAPIAAGAASSAGRGAR